MEKYGESISFVEKNEIQNTIEKTEVEISYISGHYRNQPYGVKESPIYKIIWIEPYIKGLDYDQDDKLKISVV